MNETNYSSVGLDNEMLKTRMIKKVQSAMRVSISIERNAVKKKKKKNYTICDARH